MEPTIRNIWAISLPILFASIGETAVEITDVMLLARYGEVELGALAVADALLFVAMFPLVGLIDGMQIMMSRRAGQGRTRAIGAVFNHGICLLAIVSVLLTALLVAKGSQLTGALVQSSAVRCAVDDYVEISAFGILFQALNFAYSAFCTAIGRTRVLIGATVILVATNVVLDVGLIFGNFGLPQLGIRGAALASVCAEITAFLVLLGTTLARGNHRDYQLFRPRGWDWRMCSTICSLSWPVSLEALTQTGRWLVFFVIIEGLGERELAAANIVHSCHSLYLVAVAAFCETTCAMVSNLVGQRRPGMIGQLLTSITARCGLAVLPLAILALACPELLVTMFTRDPALVGATAFALRLVTLALLAEVPGATLLSAIAGLGRTAVRLAIQIAVTLVVLACASAVPLLGLRAELVWLTEAIGWSLCLLLAHQWLRQRSTILTS